MAGEHEQANVDDQSSDRNRRRIRFTIGLAVIALLLAVGFIVNWYRQVVCEIRISKAELDGDRCLVRIEALVRTPANFYTLQRNRDDGEEKRHTWMVGSSERWLGGHWRFDRQENITLRIPLADTATLDWHVSPGSRFQLRPGDEIRILSGRVRGGSGEADIDYLLRIDELKPKSAY